MDLFNQLGPLALVSRLRRLTEKINQDVVTIYREHNIEFEPRWFMIYYLLSQKSPLSIVDISKILGTSHPCVNQISNDMIKAGLVKPLKDKTDKRKRLLALTDKGKNMLPLLQPIWDGINASARQLIAETGMDVMGMIVKLETGLYEKSVQERFTSWQKQRQQSAVEVIEYRPEYRDAFKNLNLEWIAKYFVVEPEDERMLSNPEKEILKKGGCILFALCPDDITGEPSVLGTCALLKKDGDRNYELAKMAVTERARGKQIGKRLLTASIEKARQLNAETMTLETNSKLTAAVNLYRKLGFEAIPIDHEPLYDRVDLKMKLKL